MNIIIPICGKGKRFSEKGYLMPKPLIKIMDKAMINYVLDNLKINKNDHIFLIYSYNLDNYDFYKIIKSKYSNIFLIKIEKETRGAAETLYLGLKDILTNYKYHKKTLVLDCDTFYTENIVDIFRNSNNNLVFYVQKHDEPAIYSYIKLDYSDNIIQIAEKNKISNNANTGAYAFKNIRKLYKYCGYVVDENIRFGDEMYTSCVINELIKSGDEIFKGYELCEKSVFSLGTPEDVENYINNIHVFLFDLDGTLVITDEIYFDVWSKILIDYNIYLTNDIFKKYIQGQGDNYVLNTLLHNSGISLSYLSSKKDQYFIDNIEKIKIINGSELLLTQIKKKGFKSCIVTNCNRKVAEYIIDYINFNSLVDFIIACDDCINGKPDSEPYIKSINKYEISNSKCIIFEDSKTGILSAKGVNPKKLIGLETIYNSEELKNHGVDFSIKDFDNLDLFELIGSTNYHIEDDIKNNIMRSYKCENNPIKKILIDNNKLKGGFISNVISISIETVLEKYNCVFKYETNNNSELTRMATKLQLYTREYYFYEIISKNINVCIPKFMINVSDKNNQNVGILVENLFTSGDYDVNLNLGNENIDISLKIIDRMAKMHGKFWNKNLKEIYPELKNSTDECFFPFFENFIKEKIDKFINKWLFMLNEEKLNKINYIVDNFSKIQMRMADQNLTFIHGDIKSPNLFYRKSDKEPFFIDWQHCAIGKGVQDLVFFIIESFDNDMIKLLFPIFKNYYYKKLLENNVKNYPFSQYEMDIEDAIYYTPFFVAIWFGTTPEDELIDKNFPYLFIQKLINLI